MIIMIHFIFLLVFILVIPQYLIDFLYLSICPSIHDRFRLWDFRQEKEDTVSPVHNGYEKDLRMDGVIHKN